MKAAQQITAIHAVNLLPKKAKQINDITKAIPDINMIILKIPCYS